MDDRVFDLQPADPLSADQEVSVQAGHGVLEARQRRIDDIYGSADKDRSDAKDLKDEYTRKMSGAREEADGIVRTAMDSARRKSDQIVSEANSQAARMKQRAAEEIEQERRRAFSELQGELSGMAVDHRCQDGRARDQRKGPSGAGRRVYSECG